MLFFFPNRNKYSSIFAIIIEGDGCKLCWYKKVQVSVNNIPTINMLGFAGGLSLKEHLVKEGQNFAFKHSKK